MSLPPSSAPYTRALPPPRRRPPALPVTRTVALVLFATFVVRPVPVDGAGGLRGGGAPAQRGSDDERWHPRGRALATDGPPPVMTNWALTALEPATPRPAAPQLEPVKVDDRGTELAIEPFVTDLLAVDFPYNLKYRTEQELSGAVSSYVTSFLRGALVAPPRELGLTCSKHEEPVGPEVRWVLECEGVAVFSEAGMRTRALPDINGAVQKAFLGEAKTQFLAKMYPQYEMAKEKKEWDAEQGRRSKKEKEKKKKKKKKKKKRKKKYKESQRDKKPQKKSQKNKKLQDEAKLGDGEKSASGSQNKQLSGWILDTLRANRLVGKIPHYP